MSDKRQSSVDPHVTLQSDVSTAKFSTAGEQTIVLGGAGQSVFHSLGQQFSELPRVLLRDDDAGGAEPLAQVNSGEVPAGQGDGRYQLHGEIARGGMGAILKGRDTDLGRDLAIKVLLDSHKDKPEVVQRFVEEAQIAGQLQHPGIVPVYEMGQFADQRPFFSMKLVKGQTLAALLAERESPAADRTRFLGVFQQICQTLAYAHSRGVIHRDLKPANIMVGAFGEVQVMDWGLAKVLGAGGLADEKKAHAKHQPDSVIRTVHKENSLGTPIVGTHTMAGAVMGTPAYMAPEQALGEVDRLDERTDVFGLGAILCEVLTGQPPYTGQDGTEVFRRAARGRLEDCLQSLAACGAEPDLVELTTVCLAAEPEGRPRHAGVVAERISSYLASVETRLRATEVQRAAESARAEEAQRTAAEHEAAARAERRARRWQLGLAAAVIGMTAVAGTAAIWAAVYQSGLRQDVLRENKKAVAARQLAETEKHRADLTLADMQTARGLLAAEKGAPAEAALWFAEASQQSAVAEEPRRQADNRLRARNWLRQATLPVGALSLGTHAKQVDFQPQGDLILLRNDRHQAFLWSWREGKLLPWTEELADVGAVCFSPSGDSMALGFLSGEVQIRGTTAGAVQTQIKHAGQISAVAYSADGKYLALGSKTVRIWDVVRKELLEPTWEHPDQVNALAFNKIANLLVTACDDKQARVFKVANESPHAAALIVPHCPGEPSPPALVDQERSLVTVSGNAELSRWPLDAEQPATPEVLRVKPWGISRVVASADGHWFVTGGYYGPELHDALDATRAPLHLDHTNLVKDFAFSPSGDILLSASWDQTVRLWSLPDGRPLGPPLHHMGNVEHCGWSSDATHLVTAQGDGLIRVWQRSANNLLKAQVANWGLRPRPSFDGQLAAPGMWHEAPSNFDHQSASHLRVVAAADGTPAGDDIPLPGMLVDSCICADSRSVAAVWRSGESGYLGVWDVATARALFAPVLLPDAPCAVAARPDSTQIAALCVSGDLLAFDGETGKSVFVAHHAGWSRSVARLPQLQYTPDGLTLVASGDGPNTSLNVRDAATGKLRYPPIHPTLEQGHTARGFTISSDGRLLATFVNGKNAAQVWDLTTGRALSQPLLHPGDLYGLYAVSFSPDGKHLLTGCKDGQARYWDWKSGTLACPPMAHEDEIFDLAVVPGGKYAVVVVRGRPQRIHVWDLATGKRIAPPQVVSGAATNFAQTVAVTPNGRRALVGVGSTLAVVDLEALLAPSDTTTVDMALLAELACAQRIELGDMSGLTKDQWQADWNRLRANNAGLVAAEAVLARPRVAAATRSGRNAGTSHGRGDELARQGKWAESARAALEEVAADPRDRIAWSRAAPRLILAGDLSGYRQLCRRMVKEFDDNLTAEQADSLCKVCMLLPDNEDRAKLPVEFLSQAAASDDTPDSMKGWYCGCLALVAYRDGKLEQAIRWGNQSFEYNKKRGAVGALALVVLAMAQHQSGEKNQALGSLAAAIGLIPRELATLGARNHQGPLPVAAGSVGHDWLIAEVLRREAAQLLLKTRGPTPTPPPEVVPPALLLARAAAAQADWDKAARLYAEYLQPPASDGHAWFEFAAVLLLAGDETAAKKACRELLPRADQPGVRPFHVARACTLSAAFADEAALAATKAEAELRESDTLCWSLTERAALHVRAGKFAQAVPLLEQCLKSKIMPGQAAVSMLWLAEARRQSGDTEKAQILFRAASSFLVRFRDGWQPSADRALGLHLHDWLEALLLRQEVEAMLVPNAASFLAGGYEPADNFERLALIDACLFRQRFLAAEKLYVAAFEADANLAEDWTRFHRYNAACCAARAASGDGDAQDLGAMERAELRKQAAAWLRAELTAATSALEEADAPDRQRRVLYLASWWRDSDLAGIRDAEPIEKLPPDEQALLKNLWADLEAAFKPMP